MNLVVAHFLDGRVRKGTSLDVHPSRPTFHVRTRDGTELIALNQLKALFFVRSLDGNASYEEDSTLQADDPRRRGTHPIAIRFADGEEIVGLTIHNPPVGAFFYVVPVDAKSNNLRILVNRAAIASLEPVKGA